MNVQNHNVQNIQYTVLKFTQHTKLYKQNVRVREISEIIQSLFHFRNKQIKAHRNLDKVT